MNIYMLLYESEKVCTAVTMFCNGSFTSRSKLKHLIIWQGKSKCSDRFLLDKDFAIQTISTETVVSPLICFPYESCTCRGMLAFSRFWKDFAVLCRYYHDLKANIPQYGPCVRLIRKLIFYKKRSHSPPVVNRLCSYKLKKRKNSAS